MIDKTSVRIIKKKEQRNDFAFWQTQSYITRLETLENIRQEYNSWKYGNMQNFQRVYSIIKRKQGLHIIGRNAIVLQMHLLLYLITHKFYLLIGKILV